MKLRFVILNLCCSIVLLSFGGATAKMNVGPYKAFVTRAEPCKNPPKPYEKNPWASFYSEVYYSGKKTMLRGNLTVVRLNTNMRSSSRGFILEDGKWKVMYVANSVGCNGVVVKLVRFAMNVPSQKGCVPKGTYNFKDMDINALMQMWMKTFSYGKYLFKLAVGTKTATTICWEFNTDIEPSTSEQTLHIDKNITET